MDENYARDVQSIVSSTFNPSIMVATTPEVEEVFQRSFQKRFIDLLKPFTLIRRKISLRNLNDQLYDLHDFQVRFMEMTELRLGGTTPKVAQQLANVVSSCHVSEDRRYGGLPFRDRSEIPQFLRECTPFIPWFHHYRNAFLQSMGLSEHEFFDHPVACISVATLSNVADSINIFDQLYHPQQPPPLLQDDYIDQNLFVMRVLIDDGREDRKVVETRLAKMRSQFGTANCFVLRMNSLLEQKDEPQISHQHLSNEDNNRVEEFVCELVTRGILPHIDKAMRNLNEQVMATRRGFRNQVKYWFKPFGGGGGSTPKPKNENTEGDTKTYPINSAGAICRQLADYAFMLRDYENAQTNYKTCFRDFQNDKAMKYVAGTFEMIGLCSFLLDNSKKDAESELQKAYETYMRTGSGGARYALRTTFFLGSIYKARRNYLDAANTFIRAADSSEDPLCAALFQEQSAFCFLSMSPPMYRRFAFRLIAAGDLYYKGYQLKHALGCFLSGYTLYENREWTLIDDNLRFAIGRVSFLLGHVERANRYFQLLLVSQVRNHIPQVPTKQNSYLREFLHIFKTYADHKSNELAESPIPLITNESVKVFLNCAYEADSFQPASIDNDSWRDMEDSLANEDVYARWGVEIARKRKVVFLLDSKERISVVGESISVECEVKNPLHVPLQLSSLQLVCLHTANPIDANETNLEEYEEDTVEVEPVNLLLGPGESKRTKLVLTPKREGYMKLKGLGFFIARHVWARRDFKLPGKRLNDTIEQRKGKIYSTNNSTSVRICGNMPLMEITFPSFPEVILQGELYRVILTIRNVGSLGLKNAKVKLSHPSFFTFGAPLEKNTGGTEAENLTGMGGKERLKPRIVFSEQENLKNLSIVHLDIDLLPPQSSVSIPLWVRGDTIGTHTFNFLFYYEPEGADLPMKYRLLRLSKEMRVTPSIKVITFTNPSLHGLDSYLLGLEVENLQSNTIFVLKQLTSISNCWKIDPLSYDEKQLLSSSAGSEGSIFHAGSNQSTNLFFRITPATPFPSLRSETTSVTSITPSTTTTTTTVSGEKKMVVHSSLSFGKDFQDSTSLPFTNFLTREKIVRVQAEQAASVGTVSNAFARAPQRCEPKPPVPATALDFILFWETPDGKHMGQQNVSGVILTPNDMLSANDGSGNGAQEVPVRFLLRSPTKVLHDFDSKTFCIVPVVFSVKNTSLNTPLSFTLDSIKPSDNKEINDILSQMRSQYFWSGGTSTTVSKLEPQEEETLTIDVCFAKPGVYNLNRFRFAVTSSPSPSPSASSSSPYGPFPTPSASPSSASLKHTLYCPFQQLITIEKALPSPSSPSPSGA